FEAIAYVADGDMRRAINALQAAATAEGPIDEAAVYAITSTARPEEVLEMAQYAIDGDFMAARAKLESLLVDRGIAGGDILDQLHRSVWDLDIDEAAAVRLMDRIGETEYRIVEGADERIQLESMLASLALD
ncbi:MAG: replication factor C small subunit, partial [Salinarchaeum sp.]